MRVKPPSALHDIATCPPSLYLYPSIPLVPPLTFLDDEASLILDWYLRAVDIPLEANPPFLNFDNSMLPVLFPADLCDNALVTLSFALILGLSVVLV